MTIAEIAEVVAGEVGGYGGTVVTEAPVVDSRQTVPGGMFVAVRGDHVDGHDFAADAVRAGAAAVLSQRPLGLPGVVAADCVEAIGVLARHVVASLTRLGRLGVVGITGSQGKTTCKDLLAQLLESVDETVAPVGSFNTEIGVPLTALRASETTRFLVIEMGARGRGHISYLASMVRPVVGVVLNVGVAHLGEFGSRQHIATAKGELVESLPPDGVAVLNVDDALVLGMRSLTSAQVITFGTGKAAEVRFGEIRLDHANHVGFRLSYGGAHRDVTIPLVGAHNAVNAAAAVAAALGCGMPFDRACDALSSVESRSRWRMETARSPGGATVINDAYNANPDSMRAALTVLADVGARAPGSRTFAVLGEMRELGESSADEHDAIGGLVARLGVSRLVVVGDAARAIHVGATRERSWDGESVCVADRTAAIELLRHEVRSADVVLVKASRVVGLEAVASALLDDPTVAS